MIMFENPRSHRPPPFNTRPISITFPLFSQTSLKPQLNPTPPAPLWQRSLIKNLRIYDFLYLVSAQGQYTTTLLHNGEYAFISIL